MVNEHTILTRSYMNINVFAQTTIALINLDKIDQESLLVLPAISHANDIDQSPIAHVYPLSYPVILSILKVRRSNYEKSICMRCG